MTKFLNKKSLGQNFLTSGSIAQKIAESADIKGANVLEIGPGEGFLTKYLADSDAHVLAIEIDQRLVTSLKKQFTGNHACHPRESGDLENDQLSQSHWIPGQARDDKTRVTVIEGDILETNLPRLIEENNFQNYKVVANLPYYITSKIIRLFLETKHPPQEMILMVQKEVGERIVAKDGKESILSISVKFYADPEILFEVGKENFDPIPKVDSVVIKIKRREDISDVDTKKFFSLVRAGFSAKRKMLVNNLANLGYPRAELLEILKKAGLEPTVRAEKLSVEDWMELFNALNIKS
jgi:16S rRNA (adenine1518-N6/adenine1519-N6)-dimethyltransferase